jgi:hypothetical protein
MRMMCIVVMFVLGSLAGAQDQDRLAKRYGFDVNLSFYPQKTPKETLLSIGKAIENNRMDYLLAHLADPKFVDETVADYKNTIRQGEEKAKVFLAFDRLVNETTQYFLEDPTLVKELRRFALEAEWEGNESQTVGTLKEVQGRKVFLRKYEDRWFLENKQQ